MSFRMYKSLVDASYRSVYVVVLSVYRIKIMSRTILLDCSVLRNSKLFYWSIFVEHVNPTLFSIIIIISPHNKFFDVSQTTKYNFKKRIRKRSHLLYSMQYQTQPMTQRISFIVWLENCSYWICYYDRQ